MGKIRTSAISYWRGVPKDLHSFAYLAQANYPIVQPQQIIIDKIYNNKPNIVARVNKFKNNYMSYALLNRRYYA